MVSNQHSALASVFLTQTIPLGTCVFIIVMMDYFGRATLPDGQPRVYPKNDIATYSDISNVALGLSSQCLERMTNPQAGWTVTGTSVHKQLSLIPSAFRIRFQRAPKTY